MPSLEEVRGFWSHYRCIHTSGEASVQAHLWDRNRGLTPTLCLEGWAALEAALLTTGYGVPARAEVDRRCPRGIDGKPCQESGKDCSLHNYGLAIDIDPPKNPHFKKPFPDGWDFSKIQLTRQQVEAVEAVRTNSGVRVFRWLGWVNGDTMHFEFNCRPSDLQSGIAGLTSIKEEEEEEEEMTPTQARLEIAAAWHSRTGKWMSPVAGETAQERLTRLAQEVVDGKRTVEAIVKVAGEPTPQRNEAIPAWVLDPHVADTSS